MTNTSSLVPIDEYNSLKSELTELYRLRENFQVTYAKIKLERENDNATGILLNMARDHYKDINIQVIKRELRLKTVVDLIDISLELESCLDRS
jgi:hypothetical protein